jgi:hypothetical protein
MHQNVHPEVVVNRVSKMNTVDWECHKLQKALRFLGVHRKVALGKKAEIEETKEFPRYADAKKHGPDDEEPYPTYLLSMRDNPQATIRHWMTVGQPN